ncbi:MAG: PcfJ domain-containing protein [Gammaproteobacteria bacterium]|nr:PcfJ domain-containing protein [Gammaproteobacteria bacterium]
MKQNSEGSKPTNWHRPIRPGEYKQRYLRNRHAEVSEDDLISPELYEEYYGWYDYDDYGNWDINDPSNRIDYVISNAWSKLISFGESGEISLAFQNAGWKVSSTVKSQQENFSDNQSPAEPVTDVETKLADHINYLSDLSGCSHEFAVDSEDMNIIYNLVQNDPRKQESPYLLCLLFSPFWIRNPKTWTPPKKKNALLHLVKHLFEYYPTPSNLLSAWTGSVADTRYKWILFYLILSQGGSLKKAAKYFNWTIGKRFSLHLLDAPADLSPVHATIFAHIQCLGGTGLEFERISRNPAFLEDPTEKSEREEYTQFWNSTILWLIRYRNEFTENEIDLVLDWSMHMYTESYWRDHPFSWRGRTPTRVLEASIQYHEAMTIQTTELSWKGHGWDWVIKDDDNEYWSFLELISGDELLEEGKALQHCVSGYAARCSMGNSAIVSMTNRDNHIVTIEVEPQTKEIVQVRGFMNRAPGPTERMVVDIWKREVLIKKL